MSNLPVIRRGALWAMSQAEVRLTDLNTDADLVTAVALGIARVQLAELLAAIKAERTAQHDVRLKVRHEGHLSEASHRLTAAIAQIEG